MGMHEMHICAGLSGEFRGGQVASLVLIWSGAFLLACFAPLHLYGSVRCALCYFFPNGHLLQASVVRQSGH